MTVGEAMYEAYLRFGYLSPDRQLTAKRWHKLPQEVRDALAVATSDEIGAARMHDERRVTPQRVRPLVFSMKS